MNKFYLIGAIIVFLMTLVLALPQIGGTCTFYPPLPSSGSCALALFQAAGLGAIMGGFLVLFWGSGKKGGGDDEDDE